ncbi:MAG: hypothetical protein AAFQ52_10795 [Chloroflexota bacterium]
MSQLSDFPHPALEEYKTQASILLKQVYSDDVATVENAVARFRQLPYLRDKSLRTLTQNNPVKHKDALHVIALENGYSSWAMFKQWLDQHTKQATKAPYFTDVYPRRCMRYTLEWHTDYEIASQSLGTEGGYLFPYKNQYFICSATYITELGLDPSDPDWARIGYNWVQPDDERAWGRLTQLQRISVR